MNLWAWLKNEDGFSLFDQTALAVGGILIALLVGSYVIGIAGSEYHKMETEFMGNEGEASDTLEKFY